MGSSSAPFLKENNDDNNNTIGGDDNGDSGSGRQISTLLKSSSSRKSKNPGCYTSGELKRGLSGKFDTWNSVFTIPTAHFLLIASQKDSVHQYLFGDGKNFVDRVYAKEIVDELLLN